MAKAAECRQLEAVAARAAWKVKKRLLPVFVLVVLVNYLDRGNISYAAAGLKERLNLDDVGYGTACSAMFYTYVLFQWPHTMMAGRLGVRPWLAFVVAVWGCATLLTAWVESPAELIILRLLIGFAEAGSFPLIYMHLDSFLPSEEVALCWSIIVSASQVASIVSGPLAAALIQLPTNKMVRQPWQWLFVVEGLAAIAVAAVVFLFLLNGYSDARLFSTDEKIALMNARARVPRVRSGSSLRPGGGRKCKLVSPGVADWKSWYLGSVLLLIATPVYGFMFFSPMLIQTIMGPGTSRGLVDVLNGVPYLCATVFMLLAGRSIKIFSERLYHGIIGMVIAALLAFTFPLSYEQWPAGAAFAHVSILYGLAAALYVPLDTMPSAYCAESAESYAIVNSVKSISGIIGPPLFGAVRQSFNGPIAVAVLGVCEVLGVILFLLFFVFIGEAGPSLACLPQRAKDASREPTGNPLDETVGSV